MANKLKRTPNPPSPGPTGSGPTPLLCRLAALYKELKQEEEGFDAVGNDEASCATYAAAERLRDVVDEYIKEQRALRPNDKGQR